MQYCFTAVATDLKRGGLVPLVVGQPNEHLMDWAGMNCHRVMVPGWPRGLRLEDTERNHEVLKALLNALDREKLERKIAPMVGQFLSDYDKHYDIH